MPEFYQWVATREGPNGAFFYGAPPEIDPFLDDIWSGRRLTKAPRVFRLTVPPPFQGSLADELTVIDHHCLLLSPRLVKVLRAAGVDGFDTYACEVSVGPGAGAAPYYLVVLRDIIYCVDHARSKLEVDVENPRVIEMIENLAVDESRLAGDLLFRLGEDPEIVIAHATVMRALETAQVTGVRFAPVDGSQETAAPIDQVGGAWPQSVVDHVQSTTGFPP
jgi:hypothetical protein